MLDAASSSISHVRFPLIGFTREAGNDSWRSTIRCNISALPFPVAIKTMFLLELRTGKVNVIRFGGGLAESNIPAQTRVLDSN